MATKTNLILYTLLTISLTIILQFPYRIVSKDSCAYPCYPPPTNMGGSPTTPVTNAPPSSQWGSNPTPVFNYPPPSGYLPFIPPPPYGGGFFVPPPPDPILPYFPFYFKKPPHQVASSSSTSLSGTTVMVSTICLVAFVIVNLFLR